MLLVSHLPNVFYLTGFTGSAGFLLLQEGSAALVTDSRYTTQARQEIQGCGVVVARQSLLHSLGELLGRRRGARIAFESASMSVGQKSALSRLVAGKRIRWVTTHGLVEKLRAEKDGAEIAAMRQAARLGSSVLDEVLGVVRPGVSEQELAAEIEYRIKMSGGQGPAFETIVASGPRAAMPHARPTARRLRKNELVVLDLGAILEHYCCDLTRTVYLGRAPAQWKLRHQAVREAQEAAVASIRPGATGEQVDAAARAVLKKYRLDRLFTHSCGHGLGLEVHEMPRLARGSKEQLRAGMTVTVEPGIYLPEQGGIRIEDDYLVTERGAERLTRTQRDIFQL
jgi:Xaa-Pro aminopeptidase